MGVLHADDHQGVVAHIRVRSGNAPGQELEGIVPGERRPRHAHGAIAMTGEQNRQRPPAPADFGPLAPQLVANIGANAVDVNMQLVLRPRQFGVDREA